MKEQAQRGLERFKKYCSHSGGGQEGERSFRVLASFQLSHRVFKHEVSSISWRRLPW
jgi:hypothetical protein